MVPIINECLDTLNEADRLRPPTANPIGLYAFSSADPRSVSQRIRLSVQDFCPSFPLAGLPIYRSERGKPFFADSSLQLSISHSGHWWVLGLSALPLGIDVQEKRPARFEALARRFFHPEEVAFLQQNDFQEFYRIWTAKESYVKLTGSGIDSHFASFSVLRWPERFQTVDLEDGYVLTICSDGGSNPILKVF